MLKKITVLMLLVFILQGYSFALAGKKTYKIPGGITSPAALVINEGFVSVLEMNGNLTKLAKTNAVMVERNFETIDKNYFLFYNSMGTGNSLWEYDKKLKTVSCLIPQIPNSDRVDDFMITEDQSYFIYTITKPSEESYDWLFSSHIYSFLENEELVINIQKEDTVFDIKPTNNIDEFIVITMKEGAKYSDKRKVNLWNSKTKEVKVIASCDEYSISTDFQWLAVVDGKDLIRYSLSDGKKLVLKEDIWVNQFEWIGIKNYLLVFEHGIDSYGGVTSYVTLENEWKSLSFATNDIIYNLHIVRPDLVLFDTENERNNNHQVMKWNPETLDLYTLFQSKKIDLYFDRITDTDRFVEYKGKNRSTKLTSFIIIDLENGEIRELNEKMEFSYPISNDDSKWLFINDDKMNNSEFLIYDWMLQKKYPITVDWTGNIYAQEGSNDGCYLVFYLFSSSDGSSDQRTIIMEVCCNKELSLPKTENFELITWLE
jgi:hypothetical protein